MSLFLRPLLILLCITLSTSAFGQKHLINGHVFEEGTTKPLSNVNISIVGNPAGGITNAEGYFELRVDQLPVQLFFSHLGYVIAQELINRSNRKDVKVYLIQETTQLDEVTISAERIQKVNLGDTLNVIDYAITGNRFILVASPYKNQKKQAIYLTDLQGKQLKKLAVNNVGKQIKIPEHQTPEHVYLFEDFMGSFHILNKENVRQIDISEDGIKLTYSTTYPTFLKYMFPIKAMLGGSLFYQTSNREYNRTLRTGPDAFRPVLVKTIHDPIGVAKKKRDAVRYPLIPGAPSYVVKNVSAPLIRLNNEILVFDFFEDHIECYDSIGKSKRVIPIDFHTITRTYFWFLKAEELNQQEFKQEILADKVNGKIYALFHPLGRRAVLKQINPDNGEIIQEIEIPDLPNVNKIKVHNDVVYFTYQVKTYPFYNNLYRMKI